MRYQWTDQMEMRGHQVVTPEGFLLCLECPIARTGVQHYGPGETPIDGDFVRIERPADEVFHDDAIASCDGKPVCLDHPTDPYGGRIDVTPENWRQLAVGAVRNPRQSDEEPDLLVADLMIYDPHAIRMVKQGKRQLSCGYDADYEPLGPGYGCQRNIRINHVAIVDQGRCGIRCCIGDSAPPPPCTSPRLIVHTDDLDRDVPSFARRFRGQLIQRLSR